MSTHESPLSNFSGCSGDGVLDDAVDPRMATWVAFLQAHAAVTRCLEVELSAERDLSLAEYDALLQLAVADERRLRMSELAERVLLSRSGMTRLVDRLEQRQLIERRACSSDARVLWATLTDRGYERLRAAMPIHMRGVKEHFLAAIPAEDGEAMLHALEAIVGRLRGSAAVAACETAARFEGGRLVTSDQVELVKVGSAAG